VVISLAPAATPPCAPPAASWIAAGAWPAHIPSTAVSAPGWLALIGIGAGAVGDAGAQAPKLAAHRLPPADADWRDFSARLFGPSLRPSSTALAQPNMPPLVHQEPRHDAAGAAPGGTWAVSRMDASAGLVGVSRRSRASRAPRPPPTGAIFGGSRPSTGQ